MLQTTKTWTRIQNSKHLIVGCHGAFSAFGPRLHNNALLKHRRDCEGAEEGSLQPQHSVWPTPLQELHHACNQVRDLLVQYWWSWGFCQRGYIYLLEYLWEFWGDHVVFEIFLVSFVCIGGQCVPHTKKDILWVGWQFILKWSNLFIHLCISCIYLFVCLSY